MEKEVMILGPGCQQLHGTNHCPQVAEALQLWNHSRLHIFDRNGSVLSAVDSLDLEQSAGFITKTFALNKICDQTLIRQINDMQSQLTTGKSWDNRIVNKLFTMGVDNPKSLPDAHVILATYSLFYPMNALRTADEDRNRTKRVELFNQYLAKLKSGGTLYIEKDCVAVMLAQAKDVGEEAFEQAILQNLPPLLMQWKKKFGSHFSFRPLKPVLEPALKHPENCGFLVAQHDEVPRFTQTTTVFAFTR